MSERLPMPSAGKLWLRTLLWAKRSSPLALLMVAACLAVLGWTAIALSDSHRRMREADQALARLVAVPKEAQEVAVQPQQRMEAFLAQLPTDRSEDEHLRQLFALAASERLVLAQADYARSGNDAAGLVRLTLRLPVQGSYASVRRFITRALAAMPFLALDEISLRRDQADVADIEANMKLSLFMRREVQR